MDPNGMPSNVDATLVDQGFPGCPDRPAKPDPPPSAYTNGVVTPHAAFLALRYAPSETTANLRRLAGDFPGLYGKWGFRDSVNVQTGLVSDAYLSLDQGMIMAAPAGSGLGTGVGGQRWPGVPSANNLRLTSGWPNLHRHGPVRGQGAGAIVLL